MYYLRGMWQILRALFPFFSDMFNTILFASTVTGVESEGEEKEQKVAGDENRFCFFVVKLTAQRYDKLSSVQRGYDPLPKSPQEY